MTIEEFKFDDWIKQWAGNWSILSLSYWGDCYNQIPFTNRIDQCVAHAVTVWREGKSYAFWRLSEKATFGGKFSKVIEEDSHYVNALGLDLRKKADKFLAIEKKYYNQDIGYEQYMEFQNALLAYYVPHMQIKSGTDYLAPNTLEKYLVQIEEMRKYIEPVFDRSEQFMVALAKIHGKKTGYDYKDILCTIREEFHSYLKNQNQLPPRETLQERYKAMAILSHNQQNKLIVGDEVDAVERMLVSVKDQKTLRGMMAYPGKARGKVRLVHDPRQADNFAQGDILVTGMTRPDYLALMKKAAAFVTDSGGILCHAAIVARELKKPCVIGTQTATKILRDGDVVEVDADSGIVKVIK